MSEGCEFCGIVNREFEAETIYEDEHVMAVLHLKPAAPGHTLLFTKKHFRVVEEVPDFIIGHVFAVASKLSIAIFDSISAEGTNMMIENGVAAGQAIPHFSMHIIPRKENDGLGLEWNPMKPSEENLDIAHAQISEAADAVHPSTFEEEKKEVVIEQKPTEKKQASKDDYLSSYLTRRP